jgi:hypothetical protein
MSAGSSGGDTSGICGIEREIAHVMGEKERVW